MQLGIQILIFALSLIFLFVLIVSIDRLREGGLRRKKRESSTIEEVDEIISKTKDEFKAFLILMKSLNLFEIKKEKNQVTTQIPRNHKYGLFKTIRARNTSKGDLQYLITLRKPFPGFFSASKKVIYGSDDAYEFKIPDLSDKFVFYSDNPDFWQIILLETLLIEKMKLISKSIKYMIIHKNNVETIIIDKNKTESFFNLILDIRQVMLEVHTEIDEVDLDELFCYNCGDVFDPLEEKCDKCGALKPRCIICFLNLSAIEEEVLELPCCGIYAHTKHILMWLEQKPICPNCHKDLRSWIEKFSLIE